MLMIYLLCVPFDDFITLGLFSLTVHPSQEVETRDCHEYHQPEYSLVMLYSLQYLDYQSNQVGVSGYHGNMFG